MAVSVTQSDGTTSTDTFCREREQPLELLGEYVGGLVGSLDVPCEEAFVLPWGPTIPILALFLCLAFLASAEMKNLMRERLDWRLGAPLEQRKA